MAKVTNTGIQPIVIAGGAFLAPGVETEVPNWSEAKKHPITQFYLDSGVLSLDGPAEEEDEGEEQRKADLIARIKDRGGKADKRSSLDKLEEMLVAAQQRASVIESLNSLQVEFDDKSTTEELGELLARNNNPAEDE